MKASIHLGVVGAGVAVLALALAGCSNGQNNSAGSSAASSAAITSTTTSTVSSTGTGSAPAAAVRQSKGTVTLLYVEWDSCVAATDVAQLALEKAGYKVKTMSVTAGMMYEGLATGNGDAMVCAWLPTTHAAYWAKTKDRLDEVSANALDASLGLAVPDYVDIHSIPELASHSAEFDNRIVGIDPGAGLMEITAKVVAHYKLPEKLISGSDATMTATLADAIRQHKPIVVTAWKPHWMWARWKLRYLQDPDEVYGKPDNIYTVTRKGLDQSMPGAFAILKAFKFSNDERAAVMAANVKRGAGANIMDSAKEWVDAHPQDVDQWLKH